MLKANENVRKEIGREIFLFHLSECHFRREQFGPYYTVRSAPSLKQFVSSGLAFRCLRVLKSSRKEVWESY